MIPRPLLVLAPFLLMSCVEEPVEDGGMTTVERATCEAEGGRVGIAGLLGGQFCIRPAPDGGQACTTNDDCSAWCEADTLTCAPELDPFGCRTSVLSDGSIEAICVD